VLLAALLATAAGQDQSEELAQLDVEEENQYCRENYGTFSYWAFPYTGNDQCLCKDGYVYRSGSCQVAKEWYGTKPEPRNPRPETRNPKPGTLDPKPETRKTGTLDPKPETRNPKPETRNSRPETRNPKPGTRNSRPETRNPEPETWNLKTKSETRNLKPETGMADSLVGVRTRV
jgi:hypothetical protein